MKRWKIVSNRVRRIVVVLVGWSIHSGTAERGRAQQQSPTFEDVTSQARLVFTHTRGGVGRKYMVETFGSGAAFFDYDNDGHLDVYFINGAALPGYETAAQPTNVLYRNNRDGTFTDVTDSAGVGDRGYGFGCAIADYDNDGDLDLYITNFGPDVLYRNNGDGTFSNRTLEAGLGSNRWTTSAGFSDIGGDGFLDLYVATYVDFTFENHKECIDSTGEPGYCHPSVYDGLPDVLYENAGDGSFTDVSAQAGVGSKPGRGLGVVFGDYDGDGDQDIYVANDTEPNFLWRNRGGGKFEDVGLLMGVAFGEAGVAEGGMGVDFGDFDNDLLLDILVDNYEMESNRLYRNTGHEFFADVTNATGMGAITLPYVGFGTALFDYDNDGDLDNFVANGHIMEEAAFGDDHPGHEQQNLLFRNGGTGSFEDVSRVSGAHFSTRQSSRGAAFGDYDNDGDVDILVSNSGATPTLLRNEGGNRHHKLVVELVGAESNRNGIGARVRVTSGKLVQMRELRGAYSYCSANDLRILVGLANAATADRLEIRWPSGAMESYDNLVGDTYLVIKEGSGIVRRTPL